MVTLDIEDTSIRMLVVKGRRIEKTATIPLEKGLVENGVVLDKVAVGKRIKLLMSSQGITEKQVVASTSGIHSIYRTVSLPRLPQKMLDEAAKREMERITPIPLSELYTSWQAVDMSDAEIVICLVGLPRNTVDSVLEALHKAELKPLAIDIRPLALARVADDKDAILIDVQSASFDIVVMMQGVPELLRSLTFPARDMSPSDKVAIIKEELERTVTFYNSSHQGNPMATDTAVFASGELRDMLTERLGYKVKPSPQLLLYPEGFDASEYAINIGLALKQVKSNAIQSRVNINVIPEAYLPKPFPIGRVISWILIIIAIGVLLRLAISTQQAVQETSALQARVDAAQIQVQVRQGTKESLDKLQAQVDEAKAVRDAFQQPLESFTAQREKVNGDLSKITSLLPGTINLKSISYSESLKLSGTAPDEATILSYQRNLRDTGRFSEVLLTNMQEVKYNQWDFILTLQ
jgi:type IV pilus assembly protein PilM